MYAEFMRLPRCVDDLTKLCNNHESVSLYQYIKQLDLENKLDDNFAIDIEFKITETEDGSRGKLAIKQARPWVD